MRRRRGVREEVRRGVRRALRPMRDIRLLRLRRSARGRRGALVVLGLLSAAQVVVRRKPNAVVGIEDARGRALWHNGKGRLGCFEVRRPCRDETRQRR